jgi:ABC-type bacteriocin/lantibiotic exporter with double-glycine peptidase domain
MPRLPKSEIKLIRDLLAFAVRERPSIVPITLLGVASSFIELLAMFSVVPLGILASGGLIHNSTLLRIAAFLGLTLDARFFVATFLSLFLLRYLTNVVTQVLNGYTAQKLMGSLSTHAFAAFVRHLSFSDIFRHQIGHFLALGGDEASRGSQIVINIMRLVPVIFLFLCYSLFLLYQSWPTFLGLASLLLVVVLSLKNAFRKSLALGQRQQEESRIACTHFVESLSGLRTVRGFTAEDFISDRYTQLMQKYTWTLFLSDALTNLSQVPIMVLVALALATEIAFADNAWLVQQMPFILAGIMIFLRLLPIASQGLENALRLASNLKAGQSIAEMLKAVETAEQHDSLARFPADEKVVSIEFDRVSFGYNTDACPVLSDFSCRFAKGRSYAVSGPSGVGKSSLVDLMLKFFAPSGGTIRVNGRNISQLSANSLRERIVLCEQVVRIFHGTILENVTFGHPVTKDEASRALSRVGLEDALRAMPTGSDTILTFQGSNLSGGQRQRVGVARALMRDADVLVLDESTNALDVDTRKKILNSLLSSYRDRILIFVTHDPYIVERVDEVIELSPVWPAAPVSAVAE